MNKPVSSKLFKLKKWLTLPDAAKHFSVIYGEEVTEADILRWALDGYLKLSVYFENQVYAMPGYLEENPLPKNLLKEGMDNEVLTRAIKYITENCSKYHFIENEKASVAHLYNGVFDLPMIGSEWNYIERKWKELGSGPNENSHQLEEFIIEDCKGKVYALKEVEVFDENAYLLSGYNLPLDLLNQIRTPTYYPAVGLPEDSVLVVRTEALRKFEQLIADNEPENSITTCSVPNKSELSESERNTMLKLIQGMAIDAYGYDPESHRNSATGDKNGISTKLRTRGISIDADTIRKYLNAAKE